MADPKKSKQKKSPYAADRGLPAAYDGETVTRRRLFESGAQAAGGVAVAAIALPSLGFALGPLFDKEPHAKWQDIGAVENFTEDTYASKVITLVDNGGESGKTTIYVRKARKGENQGPKKQEPQPYIAITTRCAHLGCPVRYVSASKRFICPCHGGVYNDDGTVAGGPPVRPLDRFFTMVENGRVMVGNRFSLNSKLERFSPRDPGEHLDGLWQYVYPSRPSTGGGGPG